jgi:hypothetical protein
MMDEIPGAPATRKWNARIWIGFLVSMVAFASYMLIFARFPITRDVPWVNWLLFALAGWLLWSGIGRAWRSPQQYRGKIAGPFVGVLSLALAGLFGYGTLVATRGLPASTGAPRVGAKAPEFILKDANGKSISLSALLSEPRPGQVPGSQPRGVVLIFYRGYW